MSRIITNNIRHNDATSDNITLDGSNNVTTANNFTAGGTIGCTGDLTVTSGNLVLSSGNGIDFSAAGNAGGMTSELLDDYEEGTFTLNVTETGYTIGTINSGFYTKIGRVVTIFYNVKFSAVPSSNNSRVRFDGLPFAVANLESATCYSGTARENTVGGAMFVTNVQDNTDIFEINSMDGISSGSTAILAVNRLYCCNLQYFTA